jgi:hypothetical protein
LQKSHEPQGAWRQDELWQQTASHKVTLTLTLNELAVGQSPASKNVIMEEEDIIQIHRQALTGEDTAD